MSFENPQSEREETSESELGLAEKVLLSFLEKTGANLNHVHDFFRDNSEKILANVKRFARKEAFLASLALFSYHQDESVAFREYLTAPTQTPITQKAENVSIEATSESTEQANEIVEEAKQLEHALENITDNAIEIHYYPLDAEIDDKAQEHVILVDQEAVRKMQETGKPLRLDGTIDYILVKKEIPIDETFVFDEKAKTVNGESMVRKWTDTYGNWTVKRIQFPKEGLDIDTEFIYEILKIYLPVAFSPTTDGGEYQKLQMELSFIGEKNVENLFQQKVRIADQFLEDNNLYGVYSDSPDTKLLQEGEVFLKELAAGVADIETLFGFAPGEVVKNIHITNTKEKWSASASRSDWTTIEIPDTRLTKISDGAITGKHETFHIIDFMANIGGKESFSVLYETMKEDLKKVGKAKTMEGIDHANATFFDKIDEKQFISGYSGHSAEDQFEFFATFMNSLLHPFWEEAMLEQNDEFRTRYYAAIQNTEAALQSTEKIKQGAPVFDLLAKRRAFLDSLLEQSGTEVHETEDGWEFVVTAQKGE